uniref:Antitoxin ParD1 domain protein n=3 Tax=Rhizobium rhizogenes TaxID=359 RepID=A0A7S5DRX4_RHIRH|nr:antitoxin ParD1 domain protein [Rhizobium rhizogenes]
MKTAKIKKMNGNRLSSTLPCNFYPSLRGGGTVAHIMKEFIRSATRFLSNIGSSSSQIRPPLLEELAIWHIMPYGDRRALGHQLTGESTMPTRNVVLTDHHEAVIDKLVKSGRYQNASEVLRDGLRLVEQRDALDVVKLEALREAARVGFSDIESGRFADVNDDELEGFVSELGRRAGQRVKNMSR